MQRDDALRRLGVAADAAPAEIRSAYARELREIDQQFDAAGFQLLREAYEAALNKAPMSADAANADGASAPLTLDAYGETGETTDAGSAQGQAAFDEFLADVAAFPARAVAYEAAPWVMLLERRLESDRLVLIAARTHFEARLAHFLAAGWRPGHEGLFAAACSRLGWTAERRRLLALGRAGEWLDHAIEQGAAWRAQSESERVKQTAALTLLGQQAEPSDDDIAAHFYRLQKMEEYFPAWMAVTANTQRLAQWRAKSRWMPEWQHGLGAIEAKAAAERRVRSTSLLGRWMLLPLILILVSLADRYLPPLGPAIVRMMSSQQHGADRTPDPVRPP